MVSDRRESNHDGARALAAVLRYVRSGIRSTTEVRAYLRRRGLAGQAAEAVVAECRARGLLDDGAAARLWAEQWSRRGYAWSAIRLKLSAKGFDEQALAAAERIHGTREQDEARARQVVADRFRRRFPRGQRVVQGRVARTLVSRGFDSDVIDRVLNEAFGPIPSD